MPRGRMPRSYQTRVVRPFCPTRASSWHQTWRRWSGCSAARAWSVVGSLFFERRLRGRVTLRVRGAGFLAREVETIQKAGQTPEAVAYAIPALDVLTEVHQTPGTHASPLGIRPAQDVRLERGLLPFAQPLGPARARSIVEALGSLSVEPQHGITQGLALHPSQACGLGACHALKCVGNGEEPQSGPVVLLARCSAAQVRRSIVLTHWKCGHGNTLRHRPRPSLNHLNLHHLNLPGATEPLLL